MLSNKMEEEKDKRNAVQCPTALTLKRKKINILTRAMGGVDVVNEDQAEASPDGPAWVNQGA